MNAKKILKKKSIPTISSLNQPIRKTYQSIVRSLRLVKYSRPSKKDRDIFGALVPFGEILFRVVGEAV